MVSEFNRFPLVAGRFRTDVFPVFEPLLTTVKQEIITEREME